MNMFQDFIINGAGHGEVGEALQGVRFDPGMLRPYVHKGQRCVTVNTGRSKINTTTGRVEPIYEQVRIGDLMGQGIFSPVFNATSLRKEEWIQLDQVVIRAARQRLRAWSDLASANTFGGFNGMTKMILEHETMSDPGEAIVDMDGLTDGRTDAPKFQLEGLPLPITHSDFYFSQRRLGISRNSGTPLDTTMAEAAGRRVAEMIEKTLIGVETGVTYGGNSTQVGGYGRTSSVYGYLNFPQRLTKVNLTVPTGSNPDRTVADVLAMRDQLYGANFYGPYMIYHSTDWDQYLDNDYAFASGTGVTAPNKTLRNRLREIEGIQDVRRLDYLTAANSHAFTMIMVQMTQDVCRAVDGLGITTVQWESNGGMKVNFKVMCIQVPQLRADFNGNCGILHARTA
jgi:hypothetical protein